MFNTLVQNVWLIPFFPLLGALIVAASGRWLKGWSHVPVIVGIGASCVVALLLLGAVGEGAGRTVVYDWLTLGDASRSELLSVPVQFRVDGLTSMMLAMVTFVATLIAIFSAGYMAGDPGYSRFFVFIGLFVFSMTGLVASSNFVLTYAFWEGVGVCSYLLIGFWYAKPSAAVAAKKAFLVNRVGDFGFAIAIFWIWTAFGHSVSYDDVLNSENLAKVPEATKLGIALLLFWGATAKSAQIPLYVWLPDAMEGPTPVSALIHAATMVTAGVYLIARTSLLIVNAPTAQLVVCLIGGFTALLSALIALTQTDLKRVLAYSTVSQLGYMFMGLGAGIGSVAQLAVFAGMFHLFTHAFFKALLFLGSGSVMHAMGGIIDMRRFGGLRQRLPYTHWTFAIGGLALAGFPLTAGFFSKDEILAALRSATRAAGEIGHPGWAWAYWLVYLIAVFTAFLTAFYTGRAYFLTFWGPEKLPSPDDPEAEEGEALAAHAAEIDPHRPADLPTPTPGATDEPVPPRGHGHDEHFGHEAPPIMWVPLVILAVCSIFVGMIFIRPLEHFIIHRTPGFEALGHPEHAHGPDWFSMALGTLAALGGIALSWVFYKERSPVPGKLARDFRPLYRASYAKFWVDQFYMWTVIFPTRVLAFTCAFIDKYIVDGLLVRGTAWVPRLVGRDLLAPYQNGLIQFYAGVTALLVTGLLLILLLT